MFIQIRILFIIGVITTFIYSLQSETIQINSGYIKYEIKNDLKKCPKGIVTITYASGLGKTDKFCRTLESAIRHNITLNILGWDIPWKGPSQKLIASYKALQPLPDDCVILFVDGYDVLFADTEENILSKFLSMKKPLIFGAERDCDHQDKFNEGISTNVSSNASSNELIPSGNLNSGTWIGYNKYVKDFLAKILNQIGMNKKRDDQEAISDFFSNSKTNITLDYDSNLFQSFSGSRVPLKCEPIKHMKAVNGYWENTLTNSRPSILHLNGDSKKKYYFRIEKELWYKKPQQRTPRVINSIKKTKFYFNKSYLSFGDVCYSYI